MKKMYLYLLVAVCCCCCTKQVERTAPVTNSLPPAATAAAPASAAAVYSTSSQAEAAADASFGIPAGSTTSPTYTSPMIRKTVVVSVARGGAEAYQRAACTQPGTYYATGISHGSVFSSFIATFSAKDGNGVDDFNVIVSGLTFGWTWNTVSTSYYGIDAGTTIGTATFTYGIVSWSYTYALNWKLNRNNCSFIYTWKNMSA
jgi:hypothetical protein